MEYKLRAWDKENEIMVYSDNHNKSEYIDCDYFFQQDDKGNILCFWEYSYDDNFGYPATSSGFLDNIMRYTELKDKNDREIYENDIMTDGVFNYVVTFYAGAWCLKQSDGGSWHSLYSVAHQREKIGNIYDNKELLEVN